MPLRDTIMRLGCSSTGSDRTNAATCVQNVLTWIDARKRHAAVLGTANLALTCPNNCRLH